MRASFQARTSTSFSGRRKKKTRSNALFDVEKSVFHAPMPIIADLDNRFSKFNPILDFPVSKKELRFFGFRGASKLAPMSLKDPLSSAFDVCYVRSFLEDTAKRRMHKNNGNPARRLDAINLR